MNHFGRIAIHSQLIRSFSTQNARNSIWSLGKLNHVAVVTPNLQESSDMYKNVFGGKVSPAVPLPEHGVTTVFVELPNSKIELLHPLGKNSPIQAFLDKNKSGGIHHICIEVADLTVALEGIKKHSGKTQVRVLGDGQPKTGAHGKPVVFLHPKDCGGVLIELEQE